MAAGSRLAREAGRACGLTLIRGDACRVYA